MVQPIRPQDASGIYGKQQGAEAAPAAGSAAGADGAGPAGAGRPGVRPGSRVDQVHISEHARELGRVLRSVAEAPDTRAGRVEALRQQIAAGEYGVDPLAIAEGLAEALSGAVGPSGGGPLSGGDPA